MHSIAEAVTRLADVLSKAIIQHGKHVEAAGIHIAEALTHAAHLDRIASNQDDEYITFEGDDD